MSPTPEAILAQLQATGSAYSEKKPGAREQLLNLAHSLISSLELPSESIQRIGWAGPARAAHCRMAVDLGIFESLKDSGEVDISGKDLAAKAGADETLIARTLKHLAAMNVVAETGADKYVGTPLSNALTEPKYRDGIIYTYDVAGPSFRGLPEYLKSIKASILRMARSKPALLREIQQLHVGVPRRETFVERLVQGFDADTGGNDVLLVDVGGGLGHDLLELKEKHPSLPGKLILQDRPEVISAVSSEGVFEATAHDFFAPQPVKEARAYYLHSVLHDWGDDDCVRILEQLRPAIRSGYSKLLVNEIIVPDRNPTWPVTSMDQIVFVLGAMGERTQARWEAILKRAGFKVVHVYNYEMGSESLIEAELA
ncbi:putative O-methyltransferase [Daldinia vernicosa]|uniref:putative O-methyltransferase n=1 Tax=Daldinia vernicosa TaxID=114800 RepID=UPI002008851B|nr:putative O-methyltransferase [Daldinia vernicosa]KAI0852445.1 putative O-methyltransferase [Daldinia vernicosa]